MIRNFVTNLWIWSVWRQLSGDMCPVRYSCRAPGFKCPQENDILTAVSTLSPVRIHTCHIMMMMNITLLCKMRFSQQQRWQWCSSGLWCHADLKVDTNILEKHTISIFRAEDGDSMFLWNVGTSLWVHMVSQPRRMSLSWHCYIVIMGSLWFKRLYMGQCTYERE
jgi:hypothetical protein